MTWLSILNFIILQWFFIRLAREVEKGCTVGFHIMKWIVPLTGWWSDYIYIKKAEA